MKSFVIYWLPVIALAAAIFLQSSFPSPETMPRFPFSDKLMHAGVYGVLAALCYRALRRNSPLSAQGGGTLIFFAVAMATLYGVTDEWHQSFIAARTADIFDLIADFAGSSVGAVAYALLADRLKVIN